MPASGAPASASASPPDTTGRRRLPRPTPWWAAVGAVLAGALLLRLWGIRHGLPFAYNLDEDAHFAREAVQFFTDDTLNPKYFMNPPALTYLYGIVFPVWFGGGDAVREALVEHRDDLFLVARVTVAVLGMISVGLLYLLGRRLFDRRVGLLAAIVLAVAFLPVFYAHHALNDVATMVPVVLSLLGAAGILQCGRRRDYLLAGAGLGLACATKYTAGIVIVPLVAAVALGPARSEGGAALAKAYGMALGAAVVAFLVANPYSVLDSSTFHHQLQRQSDLSGDEKLGTGEGSGILYYLWSFTWGLGLVPALAALGGAFALARSDRRLAAVLVPAPLLFILYMGLQTRFFGRWMLPVYPIACLLAAYGAMRLVDLLGERRPGWRPVLACVAGAALAAQGLAYSIHNDSVLARSDTRNETRDWMLRHIPERSRIAVEPIAPSSWHERWRKFFVSGARINNPGGKPRPGLPELPAVDNYQNYLRPELIDEYEDTGTCFVISGSTQWQRSLEDPEEVPLAIDYYRELERRGKRVFGVSPYDDADDPVGPGRDPVDFNFDWAFDYYPLVYHRPGPAVVIHRLTGGKCAVRKPEERAT